MSSVEHGSTTKCNNDSTNIDQSNTTMIPNAMGTNPPANIISRDQSIEQCHYHHRRLLLQQQQQQQQQSTQINPILQTSPSPLHFTGHIPHGDDINSNIVSISKQSHQRESSKRNKQMHQNDVTKNHQDKSIQHDSKQYHGNSNSLLQLQKYNEYQEIINNSVDSLKQWTNEARNTFIGVLYYLSLDKIERHNMLEGNKDVDQQIDGSNCKPTQTYKCEKSTSASVSPMRKFCSVFMQKLVLDNLYEVKTELQRMIQSYVKVTTDSLILACMIDALCPETKQKTQILAFAVGGGTNQTVRHCMSMQIDFKAITNKYMNIQQAISDTVVLVDKSYEQLVMTMDEPYIKKNITIKNTEFCDVETWVNALASMHKQLPCLPVKDNNNQSNTISDVWTHVLVRVPIHVPTNNGNFMNYGFFPLQTFRNQNGGRKSQHPAAIDIRVWYKMEHLEMNQRIDFDASTSEKSRLLCIEQSNNDKKRDANDFKEISQPKKRRVKTLEKNNRPLESYHFLRSFIKWCCSGGKNYFLREYTHAPLGEVWAVDNGEKFKKTHRLSSRKSRNKLKLSPDTSNFTLTTQTPVSINGGGTFLGRRWVWDEGYYTDGSCYTAVETLSSNENKESCAMNTFVPVSKRAFCDCGMDSMNNNMIDTSNVGRIGVDGPRRSQREGTSVRMASVLNELAEGGLDPHTLVSCDDYVTGPEFRLLQMESTATKENSKLSDFSPNSVMKLKELIDLSSETQFDDNTTQPFAVKVCPDAAFVADMHAHISESEIIGLLGGRYVSAERCLYIQAAFPCKSTTRVDAGLTDVEMDPVSQIAAGNAIVNQGMTVVGWYHSHPRFQPDPSITDIENQSNYQNLFQSDIVKSETNKLCPFVGLIIGTYGRNPSEKSVMRWFHVTKKQSPNGTEATIKDTASKRLPTEVYFPMKLNVIHRKMRQYQNEDDEMYQMKKCLTTSGTTVRFRQELKILKKSLLKRLNKDPVCSSSNIILCKDAVLTENNNQNKPEGEKYLLASDSFSSIISASCDEAEKAMPLPYKREELEILLLGREHGVTDDIRAGIIWHAIEREQLCENRMKSKPPNSLSILMLLLSPKVYTNVEGSCHSKTDISDDDAIIVHIIDVVLSHYATDARKINPFQSWINSRDKCINVGKSPGDYKDAWWRSYYCDKILGSNNMKMSKGHKITMCLLHWAKHMQLNERDRWGSINHTVSSIDNQMSTPLLLPNDIEFVSEVMRLFVARWLEASTDPTGVLVGLKKRGKKKDTASQARKRRKRRSFQG